MKQNQAKVYSRDIIILLLASFCYMACPMLVTPLIAGFAETQGAGGTVMGLIGGLYSVCSLLCRPFVGNIADRISKYKLASIGAAVVLLSAVGYVTAVNPVMLAAARVVNGVGFACCSVCLTTWMTNLLPRDKIGSGMGLYGTMNALAMALAPAIGIKIYQLWGYRAAFAVGCGFALAALILILLVRDKGEPALTGIESDRLQLIDHQVLPITLIIMLFVIPYYATQSFLVRYTESLDLGVSVGMFFPFYAVVLVVLRLSLKNLFDRVPFGIFVMLSSASALAALFSLTLMQSNLGLLLGAALMAGGYGIMCSVCQSTAMLIAKPEKRGLANSTYYIGMDLGMALGPILGGLIYGNLDLHWFYPLMMGSVPLILLVYVLHWRSQRSQGEPQ